MKNKKSSIKSYNSIRPGSLLNSNISDVTSQSSKTSHQLLTYYKSKSEKLEKDFDSLLATLDQVKSACDLSNDLRRDLSERNEEVSKLQNIVGELQVHLFREKDRNLKLSAEVDDLKIKDFENNKRIKALLTMTGMCERKNLHFLTKTSHERLVEPKLPPKLQKLKETKQKEIIKESNVILEETDPQVLILNNQLLASQLENHIKLTGDEINVLLKDKQISEEERKIERQRLQQEIDLLTSKLKQCQDLLCETTGKLVKSQQLFEKERTLWMEEKNKYVDTINVLKEKEGVDVSDIAGYCINGTGNSRTRSCLGQGSAKDSALLEKERMTAVYQDQIIALEAEVNLLREKAHICKSKFKEKTEKMRSEVSYLRNKYEDLDRRRQLEAEGFRTDIRMLRERVKELEKKLTKASIGFQSTEQQQLLISARNTLNLAKQLEKELACMKSKISVLESNGEGNYWEHQDRVPSHGHSFCKTEIQQQRRLT